MISRFQGMRYKGFCNDSSKSVTIGEGVSKLFQNCVTSFMNNPYKAFEVGSECRHKNLMRQQIPLFKLVVLRVIYFYHKRTPQFFLTSF
jgi:hypothetical protein